MWAFDVRCLIRLPVLLLWLVKHDSRLNTSWDIPVSWPSARYDPAELLALQSSSQPDNAKLHSCLQRLGCVSQQHCRWVRGCHAGMRSRLNIPNGPNSNR